MNKLKVICIAFFLALSMPLAAQNDVLQKVVSINLTNSTVEELLNNISEHYKIYFSYDPEILTKERKDYSFKNKTLNEILKAVLPGSIKFKTINGQVILYEHKDESTIKQTIRGMVIDKHTHTPLIGASVVIKGSVPLNGSVTDPDGYYSIKNVPLGRQSVIVSCVGYKSITIDQIMVLSSREKLLNIELEESVINMEEGKVIVYARKEEPLNEMATTGRSFSVEETEKYAGSWGDPSRMAINYAGVVMAGDELNDIVIRGNAPSALIWQLEGMPIPSPNHFDNLGATGGPISILNNNTLSRSDFFAGAFPAEYGNGYSGVFDLRMRNGNNERYEFMGQLGMAGFEFGAEGPISRKNKSSFIINYRYSMLGLVDKMLWIDELPQYQDISFKINMPNKKGSVSIFGFGGASHIDSKYYFTGMDTTLWEELDKNGSKTAFIGMNHTLFLSKNTSIVNSIAYSSRNPYNDVSFKHDDQYVVENFNDYNDMESKYMFSSKINLKIGRGNLINAGIRCERANVGSVQYNYLVRDDSIRKEKNRDFNVEGIYTINAFADLQHKFTDNFWINTGVHYQHFLENNTFSIEPRIGLNYNYSENGKIGFAYGKNSQIQSLFYYFLSDSSNNKNLDFTRSRQYVLSHDYMFTENLRLKIEVYYQNLFDVPVLQSDSTFSLINFGGSDDILWIDDLENKGKGENFGVDITFEKFLSEGYYFLFTTSLYNSTYRAIDGVKRNTRYNGNYVINALGGYEKKIGKNSMLDFNLRCVNAGGMRDTPIDLEQSRENGYTVYLEDKAYEHQMRNYFRLDFRVGLVLQYKKTTHEIAFEITNLTNHKNEYSRWYNSFTDDIVAEYQQGFLPMGLYRITF